MKTSLILLMAGTSLIATSTAAFSQDTPPAAASTPGPTPPTPPAVASAPAAAPSQGLDEIVVTAQRRSEKLQNVPLTIDSVSASQLAKAGVQSVRDLSTVVAGFSSGGQGTVTQPSIRGVSTQLSTAGSDNPNALYVDGIYNAVASALSNELPDIDHIEVLKGPQGTLFGRNATGGAVQIFTRQPSFTTQGDFGIDFGYFTGDGGSRAAPHIDTHGFVTGALIDGLVAGSISGGYSYTPGYFTNDATGARDGQISKGNLRGKLLITPSSNLRITATGFYVKDDLEGELLGTPYKGLTAAAAYPGSVIPTQPWHAAYDANYNQATLRQYGGSLKAELTLDIGTLTSLSGYNNNDTTNFNSISGAQGSLACIANFACVDYDFPTHSREISQEFDFASRSFGIFSVTSGLYYYNAKGGTMGIVQENLIPGGVVAENNTFSTEAYAAFGEVTVKPVDGLSIIGGLRYGYEHKDDSPEPDLPNIKRNFSAWTPRASIRYELTHALSVYGTYSVGYKSGLTGAGNQALGFAPVKPERLYSYEAGVKYASHDVTFNLSGFYYNYTNKQEQTFTGLNLAVINTGPVQIYGLDADTSIRLPHGFSFTGTLSYIPVAKYRDFPDASGTSTVPIPFVPVTPATPFGCAPGGGCGSYYPGIGNQVGATFDGTGLRLVRAPKVSANGTLSFNHEFSAGTFDASGTLSYISKAYHDLTETVVQPGYVTLNGQAGYKIAGTGLRIGLYGRNLTNKQYIVAATASSAGFYVNYGAPREIGGMLDFSF